MTEVISYNNLPSICDASSSFRRVGGRKILYDLQDVFVKHNMCEKYGVILLHRHFKLDENEIIIEIVGDNNIYISTPWKNEMGKVTPKHDPFTEYNVDLKKANHFRPHSWKINNDDELEGYEYFFDENPDDILLDKKFTDEFKETIQKLCLTNVLGLRLIHRELSRKREPGKGFFETTDQENRANIMKLSVIKEVVNFDFYMEVMWSFTSNKSDVEESCSCYQYCVEVVATGGHTGTGGHAR
jgi:hypothetical protein